MSIMKLKKKLLLILTFFATAIYSQSLNNIISDIRFQGLKATSQNDALSVVELRPGDTFTQRDINFAIKNLNAMQRFQSVQASLSNTPTGVIVTFTVVEEALVDRIIYQGVSGLKADKLKKEIDFKEGTAFREAKARAAVYRIKEYYRKEGFLEAQVSYRLVPIKQLPGQFDLIFEISEGPKIVVRDIIFVGANKIKPKKLESVMQTKKKMWIFRNGIIKEDEFLADRDRIIGYYKKFGYLDAQITNFSWDIEDIVSTNKQGQVSKVTRGIVLRIHIDEGSQYKVGTFAFEGHNIFGINEFKDFVNLKPGDIYDQEKVEKIRTDIYKKYSDRGYLFANISAVQEKRADNVVDTIFVIYEGSRAHIQNINVRGNTKTLPSVIKRYIQVKEGELYVNRKLEQSYNRLMQTQFFSDVRIQPSPGTVDGLVDIDFVVTEAQTGMIEFLLGYGTVSGFSGGIKLSEKNLGGRGLQLALRAEYGQYRQLGEVTFTEPALLNSPVSLSVILGVFNNIYIDMPTDEDRNGIIDGTDLNWQKNPDKTLVSFSSKKQYTRLSFRAGLAFGIQFGVYWNANLGYELNIFKDYNANFSNPLKYDGQWKIDNNLIDSLAFGWTIQNSIYTTLRFNNTDGGLWPTRGLNTALFFSFSGGALGGDIDFINMTFSADYYWRPFWQMTFAFHYDMGFLFPQIGQKFSYRDANLMSFDGVYKMRGWLNYVARGEATSYFSIEARIPIWNFIGAVAFWDYGAIFANYTDFTWNQSPYIMSFGLGLALNIPILPVRLYVARPVEWDKNQGSFQLAGSRDFWKSWEFVFSIQGLF